jgi:hypothetical protein
MGPTPTPHFQDKGDLGPDVGPSTGPGAIVLLLLLLAALTGLLWWRSLFRGLPRAVALFGRATRLGSWAGAPPRVAQTPNEYASRLGQFLPEEREDIKQLGDEVEFALRVVRINCPQHLQLASATACGRRLGVDLSITEARAPPTQTVS